MTAAPDPVTSERRAHSDAPTAPVAPVQPDQPPVRPDHVPEHAYGEPPRNRRLLRLALVGAGIFLLVVGVLLPLYVYPRLAVLPADPQTEQILKGTDATVLMPDMDAPAGATVLTGVNVTARNFVAAATGVDNDGGDNVWDIATRIEVDGRGLLQARVERLSIDPNTGEATNCCGDRLVTDEAEPDGKELRHEGYYTFPFDTQKQSYQIWDVNLEQATTAEYVGETTKDGIDVHMFKKAVPLQKIGTMELPGGLFDSTEPNVDAEAWYADTRTYWIEPNSGDVIGVREEITQQYTANGKTVTAFEAKMDSVRNSQERLDQAKQASSLLPWLRGRASIVLVLLGLILFVAAALVGRPLNFRRRTSAH
ncbi:porin PorA family protein [Cryptosporangium sp. NPDC048952]|uniref:porin PorA family protein n=1 Tax=Cryptosporangium sp. NPDC048952 TaxID=3363961 RepID=UPI00370FBB4A